MVKNGFEKLLVECDQNIDFYTKYLGMLRNTLDIYEQWKKLFIPSSRKKELDDLLDAVEFNNYAGFICIATLDLSVILKSLVSAKTDWEKIYFIKQSYLTIHETLKKFHQDDKKQKGLLLKTIIKERYCLFEGRFDEIMCVISSYKNTSSYKKLEKVRHNVAGHIQSDLKTYYDMVATLDGQEAAESVRTFIEILNSFLLFLKDCVSHSNIFLREEKVNAEANYPDLFAKMEELLQFKRNR